jgi:hypothetical protein
LTTLFSIAAWAHQPHGDGHGYAKELVGYSYSRFTGPVSGPEHEIIIKDKHGKEHSVDYVAKPDYTFEFGIEDPKSHNSQNHKEHRDDDVVHGEYSLVQPDGVTRTVKYTADKHNGFNAQVIFDGKPMHYEEKKMYDDIKQMQQQYVQKHETEEQYKSEMQLHPVEEKNVEHGDGYY